MAELGIVPAPDDPYVELGATGQGTLVRKQILHLNRQFIHPKTGKPITLGEDAWEQMKANFDGKRVTQICQFPLADERNHHTESPLANAGECVGLERDGDSVFAVIDVRDPDVAQRIADKRLLGASAFLHLDAKDAQTGERRGVALLHVAGTNRPALVDLAPYESVVAACGPAWTELPDGSVCGPQVLMLCASEVDDSPPVMLSPAQPDNPDYGRPAMTCATYDLRDEIDRLGLQAMRLSIGGRGTKPEYDHAKIEAERQESASLSAEAITEEDVTAAALELSARTDGRADFYTIMAAARELAFSRDERTAREPANVAQALAELAGRLGGTDDPGALALTADSEIDRLSDMLELAHPSKSGVRVTTKTRAHASDLDEDHRDEDQPARGGSVHAKIRAIIEGNPDLFTDGKGRDPSAMAAWPVPGVKGPRQREREEVRALAGGRPGGRSIEDLSRGSARSASGR